MLTVAALKMINISSLVAFYLPYIWKLVIPFLKCAVAIEVIVLLKILFRDIE